MKNNKLKQKLRKKEYIKTFNIKCQMIYKQYQEYFENFVIDCEKNRKKEIKNLLNVMVAPMRFGKTRTAITHHIPFLFKHTNTQLIILTSPLGDILVQKERLVKPYPRCVINLGSRVKSIFSLRFRYMGILISKPDLSFIEISGIRIPLFLLALVGNSALFK